MNPQEKAIIIGLYRQGSPYYFAAYLMGISEGYVRQIINEYLRGKKENEKL